MATICLAWDTIHLHGEAWISHHRLRHRAFVERQGWDVPSCRGIEYDSFDTPEARYVLWVDGSGRACGAVRLIPTTRPYMVRELWPDLIEGPLPSSPGIWEATRFCCDPQLSPQLRRRIVGDLICGCQEFGIEHGIAKYLSVMPVGLFRQVIIASGCDVTFLGPSRRMGRHEVAAAYVEVSTATLANVRCRGRHRDGALGRNLSMAA